MSNGDIRKKKATTQYDDFADKDFLFSEDSEPGAKNNLEFKKSTDTTLGEMGDKEGNPPSKLEAGEFGWLNSLESLSSAPSKKEAATQPAGTESLASLKFSQSGGDDRRKKSPSSAQPPAPDAPGSMRLDLQRRLDHKDREDEDDAFERALRSGSISLEHAELREKTGLSSALMPYVAAAFFFALLTGGAVFYFVAIQAPEERVPVAEAPAIVKVQESARAALNSPSSAGFISAPNTPPQPQPIKVAPRVTIDVSRQDQDVQTSGSPFSASTAAPSKAENSEQALPQEFDASGPSRETAAEPPEVSAAPAVPDVTRASKPAPSFSADLTKNNVAAAAAQPAPAKIAALPPIAAQPEAPAPSSPGAFTASPPVKDNTLSRPDMPKAAAAPPATLAISPAAEAEMLAKGQQTLQMGDVASARLLLQYLADQGSSAGAFAMGQTYDPAKLSSLGVRGLKGDAQKARSWYEKAARMGNVEALRKVGSSAQ